jgi:quercetin dioxygenase-like cupin family protein
MNTFCSRKFVVVILLFAFRIVASVSSQDSAVPLPSGEREGKATILHRDEVLRDRGTNNASVMRLWPLYASPEARMNYVEVAGRSSMHFHPDADHKLYVLEGKVVVTAGTNTTTATVGDLIIIPKGVRHCYDVPKPGDRALLLTFDAPPYDPRKTVPVRAESSKPPGPAK